MMASITRIHFVRYFSTHTSSFMPYKPEERLPLTEHQKRLYPQVQQEYSEEGYPILKLLPKKNNIFNVRLSRTNRRSRHVYVLRETKMKENQDWPSIWTSPKTFSPSAVPLPLRQSYEDRPKNVSRGKYCNTELMKVANFLHLTPQAIERHCVQLRKFCTPWPKGLESEEDVRYHFPLTYVTKDYIHASPSIRDPRARTVELKIHVNDLMLKPLDEDKLARLADYRYNKDSGILTITVDACPVKIQNQDYSDYLLTALYFESIKHEKWESERNAVDLEPPEENVAILEDYREKVEKLLGLN